MPRSRADDPRTAHLEVLNEVARIATLDVELRPMLQRITDELAARFDWEFVALMTVDRDRHAFVCEALTTSVETSVYVGYGRPLGSGVVGHVAATGEAVLLDDARTWPGYVDTMPGAMSEICVPVHHHGKLVAVLNLESTRLGAFHGQLPLLTTVADQIAGAIASAQMYDELRQRARLMEMMSEVSRTALEATDLPELLDRIVRYIQERFPLELTAIVLYDEQRDEFVQAANAGTISVPPSLRWPACFGVIGRCIRTGRTQIVPDVSSDPQYIVVNERVTSEVVVPIRSHGKVLGVLNLESASPDVFVPATVLAFEAFADQVAGAIRLSAANERLAETSAQLEQKTGALEQANEHLATAIETLHRISTLDGLTGVANRRLFDETLSLEWRRAARSRAPLSLLMIDIDRFKAFNDAAGHQNGDDCLRRVAQALRDGVHRAADLVARYGGEEFGVLLPETDAASARQVAESLRARIEALDMTHPAADGGRVTISIGVATAIPPREGGEPEELVRRADEALYDAKRAGRNRVA
ncbi:MAG TPA: diguanylate cyclase [Thermoanaerobaculia bacterium]|nr:diguanylate cyclase [Thermoanaerobaculia bacterium]